MKDFLASPAKVLGTISALLWIGLIIGCAMTQYWFLSINFGMAGCLVCYTFYEKVYKKKG